MNIKTKFNIGAEVWFIDDNNRPQHTEVINLAIFVFNDTEIQIRYNCIGWNDLNEKFLFSTKPELLNQLV